MAHRGSGAPLVSTTLMAHQLMVRHYYIVVAHHMSGAPLVAILSIALFLVVIGIGSTKTMCVSHGKALEKTNIMMSIKHQHSLE
jgi:hypothetical protein